MIFNKLIRMDLLLLLTLILIFIVQPAAWRDLFLGFGAAVLVISLFNHTAHYKQTKKLY